MVSGETSSIIIVIRVTTNPTKFITNEIHSYKPTDHMFRGVKMRKIENMLRN